MARLDVGFDRDLLIMPFDHRGSFQEKLFGIKGRPPTEAETREIASYKGIIYEGFKKAVERGVPRENAGILADEQFGAGVLQKAKSEGFMTACPAEKSGQDEFDFEYGQEFGAHIDRFHPDFVKVLVRYNPEGDLALNRRQLARLKLLSDYCRSHLTRLMFELLVPPNTSQLALVGGDCPRFDRDLRPTLMVHAMRQIQDAGVEPDVWKLEGMESEEACYRVVDQARSGRRDRVGVIVLGRGENAEKVRQWLATAARVPGFIGFAVGRTIFWDPLKGVKEGKISREQASDEVARRFKALCDLWVEVRSAVAVGQMTGTLDLTR